MIDDGELERRLALLDPARSNPARSNPAVEDSLDRLLSEVRVPRRRRPRHLKLVSALIVGGVIVAGAGALPAAAAFRAFLAQAVADPPGAGTEVIPDSDWIDTRAPDIDEFVASRFPESLPLPGGVEPHDVVTTVAFSINRMNGITQEIGVDRAYESYIYCRWVDVWLTSDAGGDTGGRDYAAQIMLDATTWPAVVATDGGGIVESQIAFARAAADGNRAEVQTAFDSNGCPGWKSLGAER